jgi:hypothetical protein
MRTAAYLVLLAVALNVLALAKDLGHVVAGLLLVLALGVWGVVYWRRPITRLHVTAWLAIMVLVIILRGW